MARTTRADVLPAEVRASHDRLAGELRKRADRAEALATALTEEAAAVRQAVGRIEDWEAAERERAEAERDAARAARDAAEAEAAAWMAGGPLARAVRAFAWRRG